MPYKNDFALINGFVRQSIRFHADIKIKIKITEIPRGGCPVPYRSAARQGEMGRIGTPATLENRRIEAASRPAVGKSPRRFPAGRGLKRR
nr:hypothetical protein [uncultured Rhodopila sp.]